MKVRFLFNFLFIDNCKEILFPLGIRGLIQLDDLILVFIYGSTAEEMERLSSRNIYAFNSRGEQVWQVQEPIQHEGVRIRTGEVKANFELQGGGGQGAVQYEWLSGRVPESVIKNTRPLN